MRPESAADRLEYLEAFGVSASCAAGNLKVIFDLPIVDVVFDDTQMNVTAPQCSGPTSRFVELALAQRDARLEIEQEDGTMKQFVVRDPRPDGTGWTTLILDAA